MSDNRNDRRTPARSNERAPQHQQIVGAVEWTTGDGESTASTQTTIDGTLVFATDGVPHEPETSVGPQKRTTTGTTENGTAQSAPTIGRYSTRYALRELSIERTFDGRAHHTFIALGAVEFEVSCDECEALAIVLKDLAPR